VGEKDSAQFGVEQAWVIVIHRQVGGGVSEVRETHAFIVGGVENYQA
jgi:hypothetical protein